MSLTLRPYQPTDANVITTWIKSEYLMRQWCADRYERFPVTSENMNSYHQQYIGGHNSVALTMVDGEEIVGYITLRTPADDSSEQRLGFVIVNDSKRGKGLGKTLVCMAVDYAFSKLKFCSIACGAKFIFNCANHTLKSLSTYTFPLFFEEWGLQKSDVASAWDNKGDIIIGNDVWIGYDAIIMAGVTIGDGAIIGTRAVVTKDVEPYSIVGGIPAKEIRKRFAPDIMTRLQKLQWWNWESEKIQSIIQYIQNGNIEVLEKL